MEILTIEREYEGKTVKDFQLIPLVPYPRYERLFKKDERITCQSSSQGRAILCN